MLALQDAGLWRRPFTKQESEKSPCCQNGNAAKHDAERKVKFISKLYVTRSLKEIMPTLQNVLHRLSAIEGALKAMKNTPSSLWAAVQTEAKILQRFQRLRRNPEKHTGSCQLPLHLRFTILLTLICSACYLDLIPESETEPF
jgi:hypothetical protein